MFRYKKSNILKKSNISLRIKIKSFVQELNGMAPYEKSIINFLKLGKEKKAIKFAKKRLGNIQRAKMKIESLNNLTRFI
jgi:large subunit ribosomal protein L36e